ncbi:site-specific integrase [Sulfurimonas sp.]|uniref:tyrosine-type recombinase/integrase n=1 Tax=Sulfurimonas sp. TaxID=2022749 RepID=UPI0025D506D0|nr:site-specific integrase [Sulfurimonas sp.]
MALNNFLIKIEVDGLDTKGLYLKDTINQFKKQEKIIKNHLKKLDYSNIDIVLKFYFRNKQIKKTLKYNNITGLQAVKKAAIKRSEFKEELEHCGVIQKKNFKSLNELWDDYIKYKSTTLSPENIYTSKKSFSKWIKPDIGHMEVKSIMTSDIQNIVNSILRKGLKPRTAQTIKQILRPLYNHAIDIGICEVNPAIKVNIPVFDNTVDFQLTEEKRTKLFEEIKKYEPLKYRGIMLFLYTGRRLNEVLTLQWNSIDLDHNVYTIEAEYNKIRRRQDYRLSVILRDFFVEYGIFKSGYIFPGEKTAHITSSTFRRHWKKIIKNAGIEQMRIHDTRHAIGNYLVNNGATLEGVGKLLGHSGIGVTKRYAKPSVETADKLLNSYLD